MPTSRVKIRKPKTVFKDLSKDGVVGLAYDDEHKAEIDPKQSDRELFLTAFHEYSHLTIPDLTEKQVIKLEKTIGVSLWKIVCRLRRKWLKPKI